MNKAFCFLSILSCTVYAGIFCIYYSQYQQDAWLNEYFFKNKKSGVFVDIGAHDGVTLSNTCFFEKELGWTGICVEPLSGVFEELKANRGCICIKGCIAPTSGKAQFLKIIGDQDNVMALEMLSGLLHAYDVNHLQRIDKAITQQNGKKETIEVDCFKLNDLLDQYKIYHIDYLSIDTEGGELDILKSIDYQKYLIDIIEVENNYNNEEFANFLNSKGYVLVGRLPVVGFNIDQNSPEYMAFLKSKECGYEEIYCRMGFLCLRKIF